MSTKRTHHCGNTPDGRITSAVAQTRAFNVAEPASAVAITCLERSSLDRHASIDAAAIDTSNATMDVSRCVVIYFDPATYDTSMSRNVVGAVTHVRVHDTSTDSDSSILNATLVADSFTCALLDPDTHNMYIAGAIAIMRTIYRIHILYHRSSSLQTHTQKSHYFTNYIVIVENNLANMTPLFYKCCKYLYHPHVELHTLDITFATKLLPHAIKHVVRFEQRRPITLLIDMNDRCPSLHQSDIVQQIQHDDSNNVPAPVNLLYVIQVTTISIYLDVLYMALGSVRYRHELHRRNIDQPLLLPHDVVVANSAHRQLDSDKRIGRSLIHYRIYVNRVWSSSITSHSISMTLCRKQLSYR